ncbi:hypothetical protein ABZV34_10880 [Streptomyces sp. NPDC005195]|uniref:hypothetical protein n=1 Tax=Streptomyces sp. NPDC005195 TaxID=3154561 RepID=UPI0033A4B2B6
MKRRTTLHGLDARQGGAAHHPRTECEDRKDILVRIAETHHAWSLPPRAIKAGVPLVLIIVLAVVGALALGHGAAALTVGVMALLAAAMEELVRGAMRYWTRVA